MKKWFKSLDIIQSFLLGIYISLFPACYVAVKVADAGLPTGELGYMFMLWSMFTSLPMTLMLFNHLAKQGG